MNAEERRKQVLERTRQNYEKKDQGGFSAGKDILDFSVIGGYKKGIYFKPEISENDKLITNRVDIIPFIATTNNLPGTDPGKMAYEADVIVHRRMGPGGNDTYLCLENMYGEPCPVCEERRMLMEKGNKNLPSNPLFPKRRHIYNFLNLNLPEKDRFFQIFEEVHKWFEAKLMVRARMLGFEDFWDVEFGSIIEFLAYKHKSPEGTNTEYEFDIKKRERQYTEKIMEQALPLDKMLIKPSYEEVRNAFFQCGTGESEDAPNEPDSDVPSRDVNEDFRRPDFAEADTQRERVETREEPQREPRRESRRRNREEPEKNKCPYGYVFGRDNDNYKECSECSDEIFHACDDERLRLNK